MDVAGSRQILAPPHRVAVAMRDPAFLRSLGIQERFANAAQADEASAALTIAAAPVHFAFQGDGLGTRLAYEAEGDDAARLKAEIDRFLDRLQADGAGPAETAADSPLVNGARVISGGFQVPRLPKVIFGMPPVFWAGSAIFLFLFAMMFSAYL